MHNNPVLSEWNEARRLSGRNFQCDRCDQRWFEDDLRQQDGRDLCAPNCYEENGGKIDRDMDRAAGAALAAELEKKENRPPISPGWFDDQDIVAISNLNPRTVTVTRGGGSQTMVLTGVGFSSADTVTSDTGITITKSVDSTTQVTLTISASVLATRGIHAMTYAGDLYQNCVDVR